MIDETCSICNARREHVMNEHHKQMAALYEKYAEQIASLRQKHEASVMRQAKRKQRSFEIIEKLHDEHAGGDDA